MKIYTRTGDKGETSLYSGKRVSKESIHIEAIGDVDELNSILGVAKAGMENSSLCKKTYDQLEFVQHALFDIGASLATPLSQSSEKKIDQTRFGTQATQLLEQWIDHMEESLPPLTHFILPGGSANGSFLHIARSVCRRAERSSLAVYSAGDIDSAPLIYLNRLSDYLFVAARYINFLNQKPETLWQQHKL